MSIFLVTQIDSHSMFLRKIFAIFEFCLRVCANFKWNYLSQKFKITWYWKIERNQMKINYMLLLTSIECSRIRTFISPFFFHWLLNLFIFFYATRLNVCTMGIFACITRIVFCVQIEILCRNCEVDDKNVVPSFSLIPFGTTHRRGEFIFDIMEFEQCYWFS